MVMGGSAPLRWRLNQLKAGTRSGCVSLVASGNDDEAELVARAVEGHKFFARH